ncbi:Ig-like domain-containing protein [Williamsia sp. CHRR-6]|uniref:L,D-transpeptidase n=1 Tax=Williamsia sp. CHRR-6 TaxID=2835871 RepID=UPI001BD95D8A|nr:Ig-like domain-containing protein [Williamsia sp. CHRR-6]MBT0566926.1 L,D-transpeptidase family protein [Williamsia sp. CHRR-6]
MEDSHAKAQLTRRGALATLAAGALGVTAAACSSGGTSSEPKKSTPPPKPSAEITFTPALADGAQPSPTAGFAVSVSKGKLNADVKLTNARGTVVKGALAADGTTYRIAEPLGYGVAYTWSGTAVGDDGKTVPVQGTFTTITPKDQINVVINIADGQEVGIAAPLILKFDAEVTDKKAVERALTVTTTPPTEGSWGWLPEDNGSRVHWRPAEYFAPGTKFSMVGKLYGLDHGDGVYGAADVTSDFTIGRSQIVKADATSFKIDVIRDGSLLMSLPCSYGSGDLDRNVTRSGIHVVSEKHEDFYMSNPAAGYFNVRERWAVRISNNGEFIHANPQTTGVQGSSNVTNGCINLSLENAQRYYETAIYGDPVEVTNTRLQLSQADGDIYDWTFSYAQWKSMSALDGEAPTSSAPATPSDAPQLSGTSTTPSPSARRQPTG